ncbi:MAG: YMGG-like glycine zipper-containing protein, partial [Pseudomonadota bacterium]
MKFDQFLIAGDSDREGFGLPPLISPHRATEVEMKSFAFAMGAGAAFLLTACGTTSSDRTLSGAGIGGGAGAAIGAVTGLTVLEGALLGAAAGGLTGYLTDEDFIN